MAVLKQKSQLKRSTPLRAKTPMNRGSSVLKSTKPLQAKSPMKRSNKPIKQSKPKSTPIRQSAKGENCTMHIPGVCRNDRETVVWAHSNAYQDGKGMGIKAHDEAGCYCCHLCHLVLDGQAPRPAGLTKEDIDAYFARARHVSRLILQQKGLLAHDS